MNQSVQASTLDGFFRSVSAARESVLLLDFDGTLAPFRVDPSKVRPWAGVANLLDRICQVERTRIAVVTGRPARDVASQLGTRITPEIWGLHGAEHLYTDGHIERRSLAPHAEAALEDARSAVRSAKLGVRVEEKWNSVVVHWRGLSPGARQAMQGRAQSVLNPFAQRAGMELLQFDGGLELRCGPDKGDAVRSILEEIPAAAPVAYLGDDATDELAFRALQGRGMSVLVRRQWRPSLAQIWLHPPDRLRAFLTAWLRAIQS